MSTEYRQTDVGRAETAGERAYGTEAPNPYGPDDPLHHAWQRGLYAAERRQEQQRRAGLKTEARRDHG